MENISKVKEIFTKKKAKRLLGENLVIEYEDYYYKTLNHFGKAVHAEEKGYDRVIREYNFIVKYFGDICKIANTEIIKDEEYIYIIKQEKLKGKVLSFNALKNIEVREKLIKITEMNKKFWQEQGCALDLCGTDVLFKPIFMHNLIIVQGEIYIFDFGLLNKNPKSIFFKISSNFFYFLQTTLIKIALRFTTPRKSLEK